MGTFYYRQSNLKVFAVDSKIRPCALHKTKELSQPVTSHHQAPITVLLRLIIHMLIILFQILYQVLICNLLNQRRIQDSSNGGGGSRGLAQRKFSIHALQALGNVGKPPWTLSYNFWTNLENHILTLCCIHGQTNKGLSSFPPSFSC